jgi:hypothetical protein
MNKLNNICKIMGIIVLLVVVIWGLTDAILIVKRLYSWFIG